MDPSIDYTKTGMEQRYSSRQDQDEDDFFNQG